MNLPLPIRDALRRDVQRQQQAAYEAANNLIKYTREAVEAASKLGDDQVMDEGQLDLLERNVRQFISAIRKCEVDAAGTQQYLNSLEEDNEQPTA